MFKEILVLSAGLSGFLGGYILSLISPEEMESGRKYFLLLKRIFFVLVGLTFYSFYPTEQGVKFFVLIAGFLILFYLNFLNKRTKEKRYLEAINYCFFGVLFVFSAEKTLLASVIFLYGLPVGSLWRSVYRAEQQKKVYTKLG